MFTHLSHSQMNCQTLFPYNVGSLAIFLVVAELNNLLVASTPALLGDSCFPLELSSWLMAHHHCLDKDDSTDFSERL
jgi:hypothetical protein